MEIVVVVVLQASRTTAISNNNSNRPFTTPRSNLGMMEATIRCTRSSQHTPSVLTTTAAVTTMTIKLAHGQDLTSNT